VTLALMLSACGGAAGVPVQTTDGHPWVPDGLYATWLRGSLAATDGDISEAYAALDAAVTLDPDDARLRLDLALTLGRLGDRDSAEEQLDVAETLGLAAWRVAQARADVCEADDDLESALEAWTAADSTDAPESWWIDRIRFAERTENVAAAVEAAEEMTTALPDQPRAWRRLGMALREADTHADAAAAFDRASHLPGGDPWDAEQAARAWREAGESDLAAEAAVDCVDRFAEQFECYALAAALLDDGEADAPIGGTARNYIERLALRTSGRRRSITRSGAALLEVGRTAHVTLYAVEVADLRPRNVGSVMSAAWVTYRAEAFELAVELMERILVVDPANFDALNFIGYDLAERNLELERAESYVQRALELRPEDSNILDSLAWVWFRMGRFEDALELQQRVVAEQPDNAVLLDHLGDILYALGRTSEAIDAWTRALEHATEWDEDVLDTVPDKILNASDEVPS
jgi:tetratricopeptide (TPR) repeat protein